MSAAPPPQDEPDATPDATPATTAPPAAVLLAGGHGRRAGGPKALKPWRGTLMWRWQATALAAVGCAPVVAVLHPAAASDEATNAAAPGLIPLTADADAPMFASLQRALARLHDLGHTGPVFLLPVDCPCPSAAVFDALRGRAQALQAAGATWSVLRPWIETPDGPRRGHPVLLGPALVAQVRAGDGRSDRLDHLIAGLPAAQRVDVAVADPAIRANLNRAEGWVVEG